MPAQNGRELLLQVDDGAGGYATIGGFTSNDFTINGAPIDVTSKDSAGFKQSLDGGANISISTTANGIFMDDAAFETVHTAALSGSHLQARITVPDFMTYTGPFVVTSLGLSGGIEDAVAYNMSLESAGQIATATI